MQHFQQMRNIQPNNCLTAPRLRRHRRWSQCWALELAAPGQSMRQMLGAGRQAAGAGARTKGLKTTIEIGEIGRRYFSSCFGTLLAFLG